MIKAINEYFAKNDTDGILDLRKNDCANVISGAKCHVMKHVGFDKDYVFSRLFDKEDTNNPSWFETEEDACDFITAAIFTHESDINDWCRLRFDNRLTLTTSFKEFTGYCVMMNTDFSVHHECHDITIVLEFCEYAADGIFAVLSGYPSMSADDYVKATSR